MKVYRPWLGLTVFLAFGCIAIFAQQSQAVNDFGLLDSTAQQGTVQQGAVPQTQPPPPTAQGQKDDDEVKITPREAADLFHSVDEILEFDSKQTGLPVKREVKRRLTSRDEVVAYLTKHMNDEDVQRLRRSELVLKKFGLLPRDFNMETFLVAMLREEIAGYYDPKTKTVNLLDWVPMEEQEPVLAHELTHALQDQFVGLQKWMKKGDKDLTEMKKDPTSADIENDEIDSAREAVVEGQAQAMMFQYATVPTGRSVADSPDLIDAMVDETLTGTPNTKVFNEAPIFMKESLTFPYSYGVRFVVKLMQTGGKDKAFGYVLKNPPYSTRQIMQPETYLSGEKLAPMPLPDFKHDLKDYRKFDIGAIGEFDVAVLVEQYASKPVSKRLYPEWRGGYYYAVMPNPVSRSGSNASSGAPENGPLGLVFVSRWSSAEKASEFADVYSRALGQRYQKVEAVGGLPQDGATAQDKSAPEPRGPEEVGSMVVQNDETQNKDEKSSEFKIDLLKGRHMWTTDEGTVVIEEQGDLVFICENLDASTTATLEKEVLPK